MKYEIIECAAEAYILPEVYMWQMFPYLDKLVEHDIQNYIYLKKEYGQELLAIDVCIKSALDTGKDYLPISMNHLSDDIRARWEEIFGFLDCNGFVFIADSEGGQRMKFNPTRLGIDLSKVITV